MLFNKNFYPTPPEVIDIMLEGEILTNKKALEPQAGKADVVKRLQLEGAEVIACEIEPELRKIVQTYCKVISDDFFKVTSDMISHIDYIIMNPPFDNADKHIVHAFNIAPDGCKIISLCNTQTLENPYSKTRQEVCGLVSSYGSSKELDDIFSSAERQTSVKTSLIKIQKPGGYDKEFEGFFMEEDPEERQVNGLMSYNAVRDLVSRYVGAIKIFDQQLESAEKLNSIMGDYLNGESDSSNSRREAKTMCIRVTLDEMPLHRNEFKKNMQRSGWDWIFKKMNMEKYATKGLKEDINKFVESQQEVPFTMKNIYKMLEIVIATTGQRMDKALLEVFDNVTKHSHDNRYNVEGWKTNSHYLLTKKFIVGGITEVGYNGDVGRTSSQYFDMIEDLAKALCYISGKNYTDMVSLNNYMYYKYYLVKDGKFLTHKKYDWDVTIMSTSNDPERYDSIIANQKEENIYGAKVFERPTIVWGEWFNWGFFRCKPFKKGTMHFEFLDEKIWADFNMRVAKLKGYPLPEFREQTKYQKKQTGRKEATKAEAGVRQKPVTILSTIKI